MPLDPTIAAILTIAADRPQISDGSPQTARAAFRQLVVDNRDPATLASVRAVENVTYPAHEGPRPARIYRPHAQGLVPTVLFIHGGGYVIGDLDTHDDLARLLCSELGAVVVSIDYRLAPESPFPAAHLDCVAALRHVHASVASLGGDPDRLAVAGDSAGGNLSAGVAIAARDVGIALRAQLLLYPHVDFIDSVGHASRVENAEGYFLTAADMRWFEALYAADPHDPRASVLAHPDLTGVAPAVVATAEFDPLRDEGEAYALALEKAGVPVVFRRYDGLIHGFAAFGPYSPGAAKATSELLAELALLLG